MKKIMFTAILLTILLSCNLPASASGEDDIVATWRGGKITLKEFEDFALYYAFYEDTLIAAQSTFGKRRDILNDMIKYKLIQVIADSLQLDTMKVMKESYNRKLGGVVYKHHLIPDSIRSKVFTEFEIHNTYERLKYEYFISHILLKVDGDNDSFIKNKIDSLYTQIINDPATFRLNAKSFSDDNNSKENFGDMGWNVLDNLVPEFSDQIINHKIGEILGPFRTRYGWHIAIIREKRKLRNIGNYNQEKSNVVAYLIKKNKSKFDKAYEDFKSFLFLKYNVIINDSLISDMVRYYSNTSNNKLNSESNIIERAAIISSFENNIITVEDVLSYFTENENKSVLDFSIVNIKDFIFRTYLKRLVFLAAVDLGYSKKPEVIKIINEGMILDYQEYLAGELIGAKKDLNTWYKELYSEYRLTVNHSIIENSFKYHSDNKK